MITKTGSITIDGGESILHPATEAKVVFTSDGTDVESALTSLDDKIAAIAGGGGGGGGGSTITGVSVSATGSSATLTIEADTGDVTSNQFTLPAGPQGPKGDTGTQGIQGAQGPKGDAGQDGQDGYTFTPAVSADGVLSWSKSQGAGGSAPSPVSVKGPQGSQGPQGPKGDTGAQGPKGDAGAQGPKGDTGAQGPAGSDGADGYTFTPSVDSSGNLSWSKAQGPGGSVPATVNIKGPQGEQGTQGPQGERGPQGPKGDQGIQGIQGAQGPQGDSGILSFSTSGSGPFVKSVSYADKAMKVTLGNASLSDLGVTYTADQINSGIYVNGEIPASDSTTYLVCSGLGISAEFGVENTASSTGVYIDSGFENEATNKGDMPGITFRNRDAYAHLIAPDARSGTGGRYLSLPFKTGTLATTDDIPSTSSIQSTAKGVVSGYTDESIYVIRDITSTTGTVQLVTFPKGVTSGVVELCFYRNSGTVTSNVYFGLTSSNPSSSGVTSTTVQSSDLSSSGNGQHQALSYRIFFDVQGTSVTSLTVCDSAPSDSQYTESVGTIASSYYLNGVKMERPDGASTVRVFGLAHVYFGKHITIA